MKRLVVVAVMVALATAAPVMAQESVVATGTMERLDITSYQYGSHAITDEASGAFYVLNSDVVDLDAYDGQRVTVYGTLVPGYESGQVEGGPPLVYVTEVVPAPL
jgi:starvation-inducible outer membrane lipoprotein